MTEKKEKKGHQARFKADPQWAAKCWLGTQWAFHNVIVHPVMTVCDCIHGVTSALRTGSQWFHDWSAPGKLEPHPDDVEAEDAEEIQQLEDEQRAILGDVGDQPDEEDVEDSNDEAS